MSTDNHCPPASWNRSNRFVAGVSCCMGSGFDTGSLRGLFDDDGGWMCNDVGGA